MSVAILIKNTKKIIVIKKEWIEDNGSEDVLNFGILYNNDVCKNFFFSPDENSNPNFNMPTKEVFDSAIGCYYGYILKYQSKYFFCRKL